MNKFFIVLVYCAITASYSCNNKGTVINKLEQRCVNLTEKGFFVVGVTDVGSDSAYCAPYDSISLLFEKQISYDHPIIGPYSYDEGEYPKGVSRAVYNITDTTLFASGELTDKERELLVVEYSLGFRHHIQRQLFNDDFLTLFKKDYSMLERFPEYYKE